MDMCRNGRHPIRGPHDRFTSSGGCRRCDAERGAEYRQRRREALATFRALQAAS
jgi:hypothetical protein